MKFATLVVLALACLPVLAQQPSANPTALPAPPKTEAAPSISPDHRADFFKRQLVANQAQMALQKAQEDLSAAVQELVKDCGEKYSPQMDSKTGDPVCQLKPTPPAKSAH